MLGSPRGIEQIRVPGDLALFGMKIFPLNKLVEKLNSDDFYEIGAFI